MISGKESHRKLVAAQALLLEPLTSRQKCSEIKTLLDGLHPKLDGHLTRIEQHLSTWDKVQEGDVIQLSAEHLPEDTEEQKKRKKWLLLLIGFWRDLGNEVERVRVEMAKAESEGGSTTSNVSALGRVVRYAKGPVGIVTIAAAGIVLAMQTTAVNITIENKGCATMYPSGNIPVSIPGLKLPTEPLVSGGTSKVIIPGLTVNVDGSKNGAVTLGVLNYSLGFQLPSNIEDVTLNGESLLGKQTQVKLSERDTHVLSLICS
jgi:hypothetical protein